MFVRIQDAVLGHCLSHIHFVIDLFPCSASRPDDSPTALAALRAKADQARPRDRCFLYAELVSQMTELAGQQFSSGDSVQASETLKLVQRYAEKIHMGVADDSKN